MRKSAPYGSPSSSSAALHEASVTPNGHISNGLTPIFYNDFSAINSLLEGLESHGENAQEMAKIALNGGAKNLNFPPIAGVESANSLQSATLLAAAGSMFHNSHQQHLQQGQSSANNLHSLNIQEQVNLLNGGAVASAAHSTTGSNGTGRKSKSSAQRVSSTSGLANGAHNAALFGSASVAFPGNSHGPPGTVSALQYHNGNGRQHSLDLNLLGQNSLAAAAATSTAASNNYVPSWPCPACKISFRSPNDLQQHLSTHLTNGQQSAQSNGAVQLNGKTTGHFDASQGLLLSGNIQTNFQSKAKADQTANGKTKEKSVPCQECGKLFASADRVRVHVRVAHGEKTCACEICGCGFSYRCKLLNHMRTHTGDKPFSCEVCGRAFSQKNHLKRHHMIHTGERPFPCLVCGRSFYRKDKLTRHQKVHTGGSGRGRKSAAQNVAAVQNAVAVANGAVANPAASAALNLLSPNTAAAAAVAAAASNKMTNQSLSGLIGASPAGLPLFPASVAAQIRSSGVDTTTSNWVTHLVDGRALDKDTTQPECK